MPVCSGLSALIQAATSQLGHLIDSDAPEPTQSSSNYFADGYASSSDGDGRSSTPVWASNMISDDSRKSTFPELLMSVLSGDENSDIITFLPDGKFFAVRVKEFSDDILRRRFNLSTFDQFLDLAHGWGFTVISSIEEGTEGSTSGISENSIQVFRHPHFRKGASVDLRQVRFSLNESESSTHSVPGRARIEYSMSDDSSSTSAKRPLSPSHMDRDSVDIAQKHRVLLETETNLTSDNDHGSVISNHSTDHHSRPQRRRSSTEIRSKALAVTAAQLSLDDGQIDNAAASKAERRASLPLVDGGLDKATHTIVTDAIETLLFDEGHTRETYLKHEKELSKSSLPGVIPISKQLFAQAPSCTTRPASRAEQIAEVARALEDHDSLQIQQSSDSKEEDLRRVPVGIACPAPLETAAALMGQAERKSKG